jgi:hypothetical protein
LISSFVSSQSNVVAKSADASQADAKTQERILDQFGKLPLSFEANQGQTDSRVKFFSRTSTYTLFLTADEAVLAVRGEDEISPQALKPVSLENSRENSSSTAESRVFLPVGGHSKNQSTDGVLRMKLRGANPAARVSGMDELAGKSNYFLGKDPTQWRTNVPTYEKVKYEGIYSGVDLVYYGNQCDLEYDFIVAPGADPRRVGFEINGAKRISRNASGELVFKVGDGEIRWRTPVVYQEKDGVREPVRARYVIAPGNRVQFAVGKYDARRTLYIDPLIYSTYLGGNGSDGGYAVATDSAGNTYVAGFTCSANFPTANALQSTYRGGSCPAPADAGGDAFVTKINPRGTAFVYSTYLGGSGTDIAYGIAVDSAGNAYVTGQTGSSDFPTVNALQPTYNSADGGTGFVTEISASGSALIYSTFLGGTAGENGYGIAVSSSGSAYITGQTSSTDFPVTSGAFQTTCASVGAENGCWSGFVANINPSGTALVYATYLGGSVIDYGLGVAVDGAGDAYVTGFTASPNFPTTPGAFSTECGVGSCETIFVSKFNPEGSAMVYSTFLGGTWWLACCAGIAVDTAGSAYVTGATPSYDFPVTPGAFQPVNNGCNTCFGVGADAFVSKFTPDGSALVYSTYLGGSGEDGASGIAVDSAGNAYVVGTTFSKDFPITPHAFQTKTNGSDDVFVVKFNATGSALYYSTYVGGPTRGKTTKENYGNAIAVDDLGNAYVTGQTGSTKFPTSLPLQATYGGGAYDAFALKLNPIAWTTTTISSSPNPSTQGEAVIFTAKVSSSAGAPPDGESVSFMMGTALLGTGTLSGGSASFTTSALKVGTHSIAAVYGGDANLAKSKSVGVKQVVEKSGE